MTVASNTGKCDLGIFLSPDECFRFLRIFINSHFQAGSHLLVCLRFVDHRCTLQNFLDAGLLEILNVLIVSSFI